MNTHGADSFNPTSPVSISLGRPRVLFLALMIGNMAQGLAFTAFHSALPQMARDLGSHGEFVAQMTLALAALGLLIGALASGWILERAGTRLTLLTSTLAFGVVGAGGLVLRDPMLLLATRFVVGFADACMVTACVWGIAIEYSGARRARALGICSALANFAALTGTLVGGFLAVQGGWRLAFVQYPVFGLLAFLVAFASVGQVKPTKAAVGNVAEPFFARLLPLYLLATLLFTVMFMGSTQFAFLLEEDGIRSPGTRSLVMSAMTVLAALTSCFYGPVQQRLGARGAFLLSLICVTTALVTIGAGKGRLLAILGAAMMGVYVGLAQPYVYHVVTERTDTFSRSRALGLLSAFNFLGGFLNPILFAPLGKAIGMRNVFLLAALMMATFAVAALAGLVHQRAVRATPTASAR
jgi:MFS family permease